MQAFDCTCRYVAACILCESDPKSILNTQTDVLRLSLVAEVRPSVFLPSPSPSSLLHKHLFFGAMWVTPASRWRRWIIRSPYKVLAITAGFTWELTIHPRPLSGLDTRLGGEEEEGHKGELNMQADRIVQHIHFSFKSRRTTGGERGVIGKPDKRVPFVAFLRSRMCAYVHLFCPLISAGKAMRKQMNDYNLFCAQMCNDESAVCRERGGKLCRKTQSNASASAFVSQ